MHFTESNHIGSAQKKFNYLWLITELIKSFQYHHTNSVTATISMIVKIRAENIGQVRKVAYVAIYTEVFIIKQVTYK